MMPGEYGRNQCLGSKENQRRLSSSGLFSLYLSSTEPMALTYFFYLVPKRNMCLEKYIDEEQEKEPVKSKRKMKIPQWTLENVRNLHGVLKSIY